MAEQVLLPQAITPRDQDLILDEKLFRGLYFGDRLPSGVTIIYDTRIVPKCSRLFFKLVIQVYKYTEAYNGLRTWALYSGCPLAEDINDNTLIHDSHHLKPIVSSMYDQITKYQLKYGVLLPFRNFTIIDGKRTFLPFYNTGPCYFYKCYNFRDHTGVPMNNSIVVSTSGVKPLGLRDCVGNKVKCILAPSGAGKSYFVDSQPKGWYIDGDSIMDWPDQTKPGWKEWWTDKDKCSQVNKANWAKLIKTGITDAVYLYNGDTDQLPDDWREHLSIECVVVPTLVHHKRNIESRGTDSHQPIKWEVIGPNRVSVTRFASLHGIPNFTRFSTYSNIRLRKVLAAASEAYNSLKGDGRRIMILPCDTVYINKGTLPYLNICSEKLTFGADVSLRIHSQEYARFSGLTQHIWRHRTRFLPTYYILLSIGIKPEITYTKCGHIGGLKVKGFDVNPSGHMLGVLTWVAFPHAHIHGMPIVYPDISSYLSRYIRNQTDDTLDLEPSFKDVAYHSWIETLGGVIGSYFSIKLLLKGGLKTHRRHIMIWRLYVNWIIRHIKVNDRTSIYLQRSTNRDLDPRFGPVVL